MEGNKPLWKDWPQKKPCLVQRYCVFLTDVYYHQFPGTHVPCTCSFHTVWGLGMRLPTSWGQFGGMISQPPLEHGLNLKCWYIATEASNTTYYTCIPHIHTYMFAGNTGLYNWNTVEPPKTDSPYYGNLHNVDKSPQSRIIPYTIVYVHKETSVLRTPPK